MVPRALKQYRSRKLVLQKFTGSVLLWGSAVPQTRFQGHRKLVLWDIFFRDLLEMLLSRPGLSPAQIAPKPGGNHREQALSYHPEEATPLPLSHKTLALTPIDVPLRPLSLSLSLDFVAAVAAAAARDDNERSQRGRHQRAPAHSSVSNWRQ